MSQTTFLANKAREGASNKQMSRYVKLRLSTVLLCHVCLNFPLRNKPHSMAKLSITTFLHLFLPRQRWPISERNGQCFCVCFLIQIDISTDNMQCYCDHLKLNECSHSMHIILHVVCIHNIFAKFICLYRHIQSVLVLVVV
jgi:hypothetical protein